MVSENEITKQELISKLNTLENKMEQLSSKLNISKRENEKLIKKNQDLVRELDAKE